MTPELQHHGSQMVESSKSRNSAAIDKNRTFGDAKRRSIGIFDLNLTQQMRKQTLKNDEMNKMLLDQEKSI